MRRIMLAVAIGLLGLPGCGTDPPTPPPLTPSPSATPSAPTAPELPPEAQGSSRKAAKAFVEYYFSALSYAANTGDTSLVTGVSNSTCESCKSVVSAVDEIYAEGGRAQGDGYGFKDGKSRPGPESRTWVVEGTLQNYPQDTWRSPNSEPEHTPASEVPVSFLVKRTAHGWEVLQWTQLGS